MIRQRNIIPDSSVGEEVLELTLLNMTADTITAIYLADVEKLVITEVGGLLSALGGGTIDIRVLYDDDAGDPADTSGTSVYDTANDTTYRLDAADEAKAFRPNPVQPIEVPGQPQTLVNTDKKGVLLKLCAIEVGTLTDGDGKVWVRYRPYRPEDV